MIRRFGLLFLWMLTALAACTQEDIDRPVDLPSLDANFFRCEVQPVLVARCSYMACHGNVKRPFRVYAEQRFRLDLTWDVDEYDLAITEQELAANLQMVRGFVGRGDGDVDLLTEKPLDTRAGGLFHRGKGPYGDDDTFVDRSDPSYVILSEFVAGAQAEDGCVPREEVGL